MRSLLLQNFLAEPLTPSHPDPLDQRLRVKRFPALFRPTSFSAEGNQLIKNMTDAFAAHGNQVPADQCLDECTGKEFEARPACRRCDEIQARSEEKLGPGEVEMETKDDELDANYEGSNEGGGTEGNHGGGNTNEQEGGGAGAGSGGGGGGTGEGNVGGAGSGSDDDQSATGEDEGGGHQTGNENGGFKCFRGKFLERGSVKQFKYNSAPDCTSVNTHNMQGECALEERLHAQAVCAKTPQCGGIVGRDGIWYLRDGFGRVRDDVPPGWGYCVHSPGPWDQSNRPNANVEPFLGPDAIAVEGGVGAGAGGELALFGLTSAVLRGIGSVAAKVEQGRRKEGGKREDGRWKSCWMMNEGKSEDGCRKKHALIAFARENGFF
mmetsp:Transcript_21542/g.54309  ORF Transcript_21542/g.54309 Transcript_21542/m.54309 type:complete len:379 (+) Transcript_21542:97-1233(+)|eukprot:CAMPEP_0178985630 /NCGR_PEP_ID=MMETSP0795-20121207/2256_1 /TAXON_ID=88552 /ORGANISM="Amoebophrya sp., Strain Ameob2" /LENGTH=378 /DNA_ID=CAMNT_0020676603 /DNA_START=68 /DNA_END=1204 /DNA_ORIENTATION=-